MSFKDKFFQKSPLNSHGGPHVGPTDNYKKYLEQQKQRKAKLDEMSKKVKMQKEYDAKMQEYAKNLQKEKDFKRLTKEYDWDEGTKGDVYSILRPDTPSDIYTSPYPSPKAKEYQEFKTEKEAQEAFKKFNKPGNMKYYGEKISEKYKPTRFTPHYQMEVYRNKGTKDESHYTSAKLYSQRNNPDAKFMHRAGDPVELDPRDEVRYTAYGIPVWEMETPVKPKSLNFEKIDIDKYNKELKAFEEQEKAGFTPPPTRSVIKEQPVYTGPVYDYSTGKVKRYITTAQYRTQE